MASLRMARTPKNISRKFWGCPNYKWCEEDVDERDVIIMTQMRQINDLKKSLKVVEKRLQLK
ncbi:hypothetical protein DEO72_LG9g1069 [Vigna unguiculata]|uniref:Zinc finger GRF-type domain-containing protein n=1 Tax=Vigna unguiculata TaxID=3917 RepID=A0A4D6MX13_VIGUN|nr:hypothetical protein DEO72_LG9g1069 [Vigna unguiculata]